LLVGLPVSTLTGHSRARQIGLIKGQQAALARANVAASCAGAQ